MILQYLSLGLYRPATSAATAAAVAAAVPCPSFWQHLKDRMQSSGAHSPKSNWLRFLLVRKRAPQGVSTARKDKTPASKKTVSSSDPAAFVTGRRMLVKTKDSERGALGGGCVGGRRSPPTVSCCCCCCRCCCCC